MRNGHESLTPLRERARGHDRVDATEFQSLDDKLRRLKGREVGLGTERATHTSQSATKRQEKMSTLGAANTQLKSALSLPPRHTEELERLRKEEEP